MLYFLENLLLGENHVLRNREIHVQYDAFMKREESDKDQKSFKENQEEFIKNEYQIAKGGQK